MQHRRQCFFPGIAIIYLGKSFSSKKNVLFVPPESASSRFQRVFESVCVLKIDQRPSLAVSFQIFPIILFFAMFGLNSKNGSQTSVICSFLVHPVLYLMGVVSTIHFPFKCNTKSGECVTTHHKTRIYIRSCLFWLGAFPLANFIHNALTHHAFSLYFRLHRWSRKVNDTPREQLSRSRH